MMLLFFLDVGPVHCHCSLLLPLPPEQARNLSAVALVVLHDHPTY
jgi:hypothetical protein